MASLVHRALFVLFLLGVAVQGVVSVLDIAPPSKQSEFEALFWLLAAACTITGLWRRVPLQNVAMACALVAALGYGAEALCSSTAVPFGPRLFTGVLGGEIGEWAPPVIACIWIVMAVNARGVVRLILRPWRKTTYYGFWVIGWTAVLVSLFGLGLDPFATQTKRYWVYGPTRLPVSYHGTPWVTFVGRAAVAIAMLGFTTPWLINKQPVKQPPDYHPLALWIAFQILFIAVLFAQQRWVSAAALVTVAGVASVLAVRGARWTQAA